MIYIYKIIKNCDHIVSTNSFKPIFTLTSILIVFFITVSFMRFPTLNFSRHDATSTQILLSYYCNSFYFANKNIRWEHCHLYMNKTELSNHVINHIVPESQGLFYCKWENCTRGHRAFNAK